MIICEAMNERMIDIKKKVLLDEFLYLNQLASAKMVWNEAWNVATQASVDIALEILREVLRDETSELTYGAAGDIQNRLHKELDGD